MRNFDYTELEKSLWDSEIIGLIAQIHEYKGRQELYLKQKPAELDRLIEIAKVQSTEASNEIEGIRTTNTRLLQLVKDKTTRLIAAWPVMARSRSKPASANSMGEVDISCVRISSSWATSTPMAADWASMVSKAPELIMKI